MIDLQKKNLVDQKKFNCILFVHLREFEAQIRTYEGEDPLANWYRYEIQNTNHLGMCFRASHIEVKTL